MIGWILKLPLDLLFLKVYKYTQAIIKELIHKNKSVFGMIYFSNLIKNNFLCNKNKKSNNTNFYSACYQHILLDLVHY